MKLRNLVIGLATAAAMYSCGEATETKKAETTTSSSTDAAAAEEIYKVDAASSTLTWKGTMLNVKDHFGKMKLTEGSVTLKGDQVTGGTFTADLKSLAPEDANYNEEYTKEKLVGHLMTADFFDTEKYPTATFVVKSSEGNTLTGDLTVRGITKEEKVTDVVVEKTEEGVKATGKLVFNRQNYDVKWSSGAKDMVLSDDIEVNIELLAKK